jgi:hypothetical protein
VPYRRQSKLSMSLQQHEIGLKTCPPRRPRNPIAGVPEICNLEFGLWKPNTCSFRVGDQVGCTMEKEVRRYKKINLALVIAEGESITTLRRAWERALAARGNFPDDGVSHVACPCPPSTRAWCNGVKLQAQELQEPVFGEDAA